jgi:hypothetical protein
MEWLRIRRQANPSCVEAIAVNAKDIAAIDRITKAMLQRPGDIWNVYLRGGFCILYF